MMFRRILAAALAVFVFCAASPTARAQVIPTRSATVLAGAKKDLYPRAVMALDFAGVGTGGTPWYKAGGAISTQPSTLRGYNFSRALAAYAEDIEGNLTLFPAGSPRVTNKGVLIEEARTNVLLQSTTLANFSAPNSTNTTDGTLSLTGNLARKVTSQTAAATSFNYNIGGSASAGANTVSVYAKRGSGSTDANTFALRNATTATTLVAIAVNYDTGVFSYSAGSSGAVVTPMSNGWWRISLTSASFSAGDNLQFYAAFQGNAEAAGEYAYLADAQGEGGAFVTSYIPTTSVGVVRPADVFSFAAGTLPLQSAMSFVVDTGQVANTTNVRWAFQTGADALNNRIGLAANAAATTFINRYVTAGAGKNASDITGALFLAASNRMALAYAIGADVRAAANGALAATPGGDPTSLPSQGAFNVGAGNDGFNQFNGYIQRILVYPFALTNTELQAATMPGETSALRLDFARGTYKVAGGYVRTNGFKASDDFTAAAWAKSGGVVFTADQALAPDGTLTADLYTGANNYAYFSQAFSGGSVSGAPYTASVYVKAGSVAQISMFVGDVTSTNGVQAQFFLTGSGSFNGLTTVGTGGNARPSIEALPNGWFRCSLTGSYVGTASATTISNSSAGAGTLYFWRGQFEQSGYPSTAIQTPTTSTASITTYSSTNPADVGNMTFTRASTGYAEDASGNLVLFGSGVPRITNKGVLIEPAATNSIRNSTPGNGAIVGVIGSGGAAGTNWGVSAAGPTVTIVGTGTEGGLPYLDVRVAGTSSVAEIAFLFEGSSAVAAASGQTWTYSQYIRLAGGDLTNITAPQLVLYERNNVGSALGNTTVAATLTETRSRPYVTRTLNQATTAFVSQKLILVPVIGQPVDFTLRIFPPQMEQGSVPSSYIPTTSVAVTRPADMLSYSGLSGLSADHTLVATALMPGGPTNVNRLADLSDGGISNSEYLSYSNPALLTSDVVAGVGASGAFTTAPTSGPASMSLARIGTGIRTSHLGNPVAVAATSVPAGLTTLTIGNRPDGARSLSNYVQRVALYLYGANDNEQPYRAAGNY